MDAVAEGDLSLALEVQGRDEVARQALAFNQMLLEGFSLHADTHVHAHDRAGIERLCPVRQQRTLALERLSTREDGRCEYRTRKEQVMVFTAAQLVKRLLALIPPRGVHLTRLHGVFAPNAKLRPLVIRPQEPGQAEDPHHVLRTTASTVEKKRPRLDWASLQRRTFEEGVWRCPCGGRRRVLAPPEAPRPPQPQSHSPPQLRLAIWRAAPQMRKLEEPRDGEALLRRCRREAALAAYLGRAGRPLCCSPPAASRPMLRPNCICSSSPFLLHLLFRLSVGSWIKLQKYPLHGLTPVRRRPADAAKSMPASS
jgi:hypothetical protein